jgi:hypothetical protein
MDADQGGRFVRHDSHPRVNDGAAMAFVREARGSTVQQAGHDVFDHRSAVPTGASEVHLGRGAYAVQARLVQDPENVLRCWQRGAGIDGFRDPHRENPPAHARPHARRQH